MPRPTGPVSTGGHFRPDVSSESPAQKTDSHYGHQKVDVVSPKPNQSVLTAKSPEKPVFVPVDKRSVKTIKVKAGWTDWAVKGLVSGFKGFIGYKMDSSIKKYQAQEEKRADRLAKQLEQMPGFIKGLEEEVNEMKIRRAHLQTALSNPDESIPKELEFIIKELSFKMMQLEAMIGGADEEKKRLAEMKDKAVATVKRKKEGKELFLGGLDAGLKLLTDLRSTYHLAKGSKSGTSGKVFPESVSSGDKKITKTQPCQ